MEIRVGIKTDGEPVVRQQGEYSVVENMLIGDRFHWQQRIKAVLPGKLDRLSADSANREDHISIINTLPLEKYLECVVGSEMNPEAPSEFLKAHAVISRSWALGKILRIHPRDNMGRKAAKEILTGWDDTSDHTGFDVCSDDHCQRYQGIQPLAPAAKIAISETQGEVLRTTEGELLDTRFSKCCGGRSELFETCWQPLRLKGIESIKDPWCDLSALTPVARRSLLSRILKDYDFSSEDYGYRWQREISKAAVKENLRKHFDRDVGEIRSITPLHRGSSGRIDLLRIYGEKGSLDLGKELWIRRLLSPSHLPSSAFEIEEKESVFVLKGKGWGHGVGLCQIGAANMAMNGASYKQILAFYYPDSILSR